MSPSTRPDLRRITALPLALAAMLVLAGCGGVVAELPGVAPKPYTETGAELNGTDLRSDHLEGLDAAASFRSNATLVLAGEDGRLELRRASAIDGDRRLQTTRLDSAAVEGDGLVMASYTDGNVTYRRVEIDAGQQTVTRYDAARSPYEDGLLAVKPTTTAEAAGAELIAAVADEVTWTQRGVERYDGGWVTRYEASGPANLSAVGSTAMPDDGASDRAGLPETLDLDVSSFNATLLVTPDGVVRRVHVHATGNQAGHPVELTLTLTTDGIDGTSIEAPAWLEEAEERTSA